MKIDGKELCEKILLELRSNVEKLEKNGIIPHLAVILIGQSPASVAYVGQKEKKGALIGAKVTVLRYDESVTNEELVVKVKELSADKNVHGILIQRPVPEHIDVDKLVELTDPEKDIDGFHKDSPFFLPIPLSVAKILTDVYKLEKDKGVTHLEGLPEARSPFELARLGRALTGRKVRQDPVMESPLLFWLLTKSIVIIGKGPTGGAPVIEYFKTLNVPFRIIDSKTTEPERITRQADIIISCVGKEQIIKPDMLKKGVILIGVGIFRGTDGKLHGDYDEDQIKDIASYYTPTPGGVGPVNVAMLMLNLLTAAENQSK